MLHALNNSKHYPFLSLAEAGDYVKEALGLDITLRHIHALTESKLLPVFEFEEASFILENDLLALAPALSSISRSAGTEASSKYLFTDLEFLVTKPCPQTKIPLISSGDQALDLTYYAAVRNLISKANTCNSSDLIAQTNMLYFSSMEVTTSLRQIQGFIKDQQSRADLSEMSSLSQFTNSASYMGSKRALSGFLVEALSSILPSDGIAVDLMCGSGVVSGAFSRTWRTIASDAQEFCQTLAAVQGGGFSLGRAEKVLDTVIPKARKHANKLCTLLSQYVELEDRFFHSDIDNILLNAYQSFIDELPLYPNGKVFKGWNPVKEVEKRKQDPKVRPYCLFTAYFANIYFGLRQCIEIDSLRYAIDQLKNKHERQWAIGALIAAISKSGTTYAGHFAQPRIRNSKDLNLRNLGGTLEKRTRSIMYEFSARLMNLSQESEKAQNCVEVVPGPWQTAITALEKMVGCKPVAVYIDLPYKREEYSRYYHVLETAVNYLYPYCEGVGKMPSKKKGERFQSEFFTRNVEKTTQHIVKLISNVLEHNWVCAWSYADSGDANIVSVVKKVYETSGCRVTSYAVPYKHQSQGRRSPKTVTEYLLLFVPSGFKTN